jgi:hypothetical protein
MFLPVPLAHRRPFVLHAPPPHASVVWQYVLENPG